VLNIGLGMTKFQFLICFSASLFLCACADFGEIQNSGVDEAAQQNEPIEKALVNYIPEVHKQIQMSDYQKALYEQMLSKQEISYDLLTEAFVEKHLEAHLSSFVDQSWKNEAARSLKEEVWAILESLGRPVSFRDPHQFKVDWESRLGVLEIDPQALTILDVLMNKKIQAYSGTSLELILWRLKLSEEEFKKRNFVVIFERGHLLPGYLVKDEEDWILFGLEMTTLGPSKVYFGPTSQLQFPIRLISADEFLIGEVFADFFSNTEKVKRNFLEKSSQLYGVSLSTCEPLATPKEPIFFGKTIFCFGNPMIAKGPRLYLDQVNSSELRPKNAIAPNERRRIFLDDSLER